MLLDYVDRFDQTLLRQRVGYLLQRLGVSDPKTDSLLQAWANKSVRGSSAKLFANLEFSPTFSERWNLSINVSETILSELKED